MVNADCLVSQVQSGSDDALNLVGETNRWERVLKCTIGEDSGVNVEFVAEIAVREHSVLVYELLDFEWESNEVERLVTGSNLGDSGGAGGRHDDGKACVTGPCEDGLE